jgi:aldose 1-epimerase
MDFRSFRTVEPDSPSGDPQLELAGGYDHCWVLPEGKGCKPAAELRDPSSGRRMRIATTQPGLQFYGGQLLDGLRGKGDQAYGPRSGLCLETQHFPDSPHHAAFPGTVLRPGETYRQRTVYSFGL